MSIRNQKTILEQIDYEASHVVEYLINCKGDRIKIGFVGAKIIDVTSKPKKHEKIKLLRSLFLGRNQKLYLCFKKRISKIFCKKNTRSLL